MLEYDRTRIVLDLGYATLPRLLAQVPDGGVDAVVITHEHPDHCIDLHGLFRLRRYGCPTSPKIPLYCLPEVLDRLAGLEPDANLADVFDHHGLPGEHQLGSVHLVAGLLPHQVRNVGVRLTVDQFVLAYATDTGPDPFLADLGHDADLFVLDATDRPGERETAGRNLLTATEAGEWAHRAHARTLLLTHLWPGTDSAKSLERARDQFEGPVHVATQGLTIDFPG